MTGIQWWPFWMSDLCPPPRIKILIRNPWYEWFMRSKRINTASPIRAYEKIRTLNVNKMPKKNIFCYKMAAPHFPLKVIMPSHMHFFRTSAPFHFIIQLWNLNQIKRREFSILVLESQNKPQENTVRLRCNEKIWNVLRKPSLLCMRSSSCDLCGESHEGVAYNICWHTVWAALHGDE